MHLLKSRKLPLLLVLSLVALLAAAPAPAQTGRDEADDSVAPLLTVRNTRDLSQLPEAVFTFPSCTVDTDKELFITDVSVVDDCIRTSWAGPCPGPVPAPATRGAWTFGKLVEGIFGTADPAILNREVRRWLNEWSVVQTVNGDNVPPRPLVKDLVIVPWENASGSKQLNMKLAPFRLLAIVARLDLRQPASSSTSITAGEGRFVFNLLDAFGNPTQYLLIFEYGLDARDCNEILNWAKLWHNLGSVPFGPAFNAELQKITDKFTAIGASPGKPNGSALNQARTNDFFLDNPWELREFTLKPTAFGVSPLLTNTVAQTPAIAHQHSPLLANYVNANTPAILANNYTVPLSWLGTSFRGAAAPHSLDLNWDGPPPACTSIGDPQARHIFSLNTCSGCHGAETNTGFKHVEPRLPGSASVLSGFLTGISTTDMCGLPHTFGDLKRRAADLCNLLSTACPSIAPSNAPITFVH
jgi:hypothetical protein